MWHLVELLVAQAAPDPVQVLIDRTVAGGGVVGYIVGGVLLADRFGLLKRKNGNGDNEAKIVLLLEQIAHQLEKLREDGERDAREILAALRDK